MRLVRPAVLSLVWLACEDEVIDEAGTRNQQGLQICSFLPEPVLNIGGPDGSVWFDGVTRIGWLSDSTVYVVENTVVRLIDALSGRLVGSVGREGEGPGEFQSIGAISLTKDRTGFWIYDTALRRVSRVSLSGSIDGMGHLHGDGPLRFPSARHVMPDGRVVVHGETDATRVEEANGFVQTWAALALFGADLRYDRMLWEGVPDSDAHRTVMGAAGWIMEVPVPFGRRLHTAVAGSHLVTAVSDSPMFRMLPLADGVDGAVVRWEESVRPVEPDDHERRVDVLVAGDDGAGGQLARELLMQVPPRGLMPQIGGIRVGQDREVWVAGYEYLLGLPTRWRVFDLGIEVSRVETPARFQLESVRGGQAVGIWRDELGVEHLQVYKMACDTVSSR